MGEEDNFTVDPMNGRIILQIRRLKKNKIFVVKAEIILEETEEKKIKRGQEEESEIRPISNLDFPSFDDEPEETEEERFAREMRDFQREMQRKEQEWREKMEGIEKKEIKWEWKNN